MQVLPIVTLWTVIALIGLTASVLTACEAMTVWKTLKGKSHVSMIAFYQFRRSVLRAVVLLVFAIIGIAVLMTIDYLLDWIRWLFLISVILVTGAELLERYEILMLRNQARDEIEEAERNNA